MIQKIDIKIKDFFKLLYFIISKFEQDSSHRQGTSSKNDLMGGFIDRWINKLPESLIFNDLLLKGKNYSVISDYFIYNKNLAKNAPDVLGLKCRNGKIIKFAEFIDNKWTTLEGMPCLEVKTYRKNQYLVSIQQNQLKQNNYYVIVESDLKPNYLKSVFVRSLFTEESPGDFLMSLSFVKRDPENIIKQISRISPFKSNDTIGTFQVVNIIKGKDLLLIGNKCKEKEKIYYIRNIREADRINKPIINKKFIEYFPYNERKDLFGDKIDGKQIVGIKIENAENIMIRKIYKSSIYVEAIGDCSIHNTPLKSGSKYRVGISLFDRNSNWTEYIAYKASDYYNIDKTEELISLFDKIYLENSI